MLFGNFVRSMEDGLEPSQTYVEVNKLLLLLLFLLLKKHSLYFSSYMYRCFYIDRS